MPFILYILLYEPAWQTPCIWDKQAVVKQRTKENAGIHSRYPHIEAGWVSAASCPFETDRLEVQ